MCRARAIVMLALFASLVAACGRTAASPSSGEGIQTSPPTYTPYPTYTPNPTYTIPPPATADIESALWPNGPRDDVIAWTDASTFVGVDMVVEGTVVRTYNSGEAVFLNFAEDFDGTFTVVIFSEDWGKFPRPPETLFYGRRVRVQGLIEQYQGTPELVVHEPWQIEVALTLGREEACYCSTPAVLDIVVAATPSGGVESTTKAEPIKLSGDALESPTERQVVDWQDAADFVGQTVTVEGQIVDTYNSGKVVFLNFDEDYRQTFKAVIFPDAWDLFPEPPEILYRGQRVRVTGQVELYEGAPEIIVETPDAIEILE